MVVVTDEISLAAGVGLVVVADSVVVRTASGVNETSVVVVDEGVVINWAVVVGRSLFAVVVDNDNGWPVVVVTVVVSTAGVRTRSVVEKGSVTTTDSTVVSMASVVLVALGPVVKADSVVVAAAVDID
jgi:hypothetical protein